MTGVIARMKIAGNLNAGQTHNKKCGHAVYISGCLVCWLTKSTSSVCLSTAEAEYIVVTEAVKDVVWLRNFLSEIGFKQAEPSQLFEDNQACVTMVNNHVVTDRNRHFCVRMV